MSVYEHLEFRLLKYIVAVAEVTYFYRRCFTPSRSTVGA